MKHEYNDNQIMSPSLMEEIAKKYKIEINKKNNLELNQGETVIDYIDITEMEEYKKIACNIYIVHKKISALKKYCSKNFYLQKETCFNYISSTLAKLKLNFKCEVAPPCKIKNYFDATLSIIEDLTTIVSLLLKILNKTEQNAPTTINIHNHILTTLNLIKQTSFLLK